MIASLPATSPTRARRYLSMISTELRDGPKTIVGTRARTRSAARFTLCFRSERLTARHVTHASAQVLEHDLDRIARRPKDDRRYPSTHQIRRQIHALLQGAGADAELLVHDRRVVHIHLAGGARRARAVHELHVFGNGADQTRRVLTRIADGGCCGDEHWVRAVKTRDSTQARQDVGHMRAEHAAIRVKLIQHDVAQALK